MRYLPHTEADREAMLAAIGAKSVDELFVDVPAEARLAGPVAGLSTTKSELEVERILGAMAAKNRPAGAMARSHCTPMRRSMSASSMATSRPNSRSHPAGSATCTWRAAG